MSTTDVLIIDDDAMVRETIRDMLEEEGHTVVEAADGKAGLAAVRRLSPRLIICDVRMPGLNGYEVLQEVHKDPAIDSDTPFIFLSGLGDKEYVTAGYKIGADDYVTKPVDYDVLRLKVDAMLRKRHAATGDQPPSPSLDMGENTMAGGLAVPDAFQKRLEALMKSEGSKSSGRLKLVTLDEFRKRFGARWEKLREKAMAIAEGVVRREMAKSDLYTRYGADSFLVLFGDADLEAAQRRAEKLAIDIRHHLLGTDRDMEGVGVAADTIDIGKLANNGSAPSPQALAREFDARAAAAAKEEAAAGGADPDWFRNQLSVQYRPLWSPARQLVVAFECHPFRRSSYGTFTGDAVLHGGDQDPLAVEVDAVMAEQAVRRLQGRQTGNDAVILLPLHFLTLKADDHGGLGDIFAGVPQGRMLNRLAVEIIGVPENRGEMTIRRVLDFVKRISGKISIRLPADDRHAPLFKAAGVDTLVMDVERDWQTQTEKQILMRLLDFGQRAQAQGFHTTAYGLNSMATVRGALQAGFGLIGGRVIGDIREAPVQPYELTRRYLLG